MICVVLPFHLQGLADTNREVFLDINGPVTQRTILDALEHRYPVLRGTIRDHVTKERRAFIRFFACGEDISHDSMDAPLPESVANGSEKFRIVGALAGG
jgi:molybdopterin synthase sulfur carrier subunit